jgi:TPR repeat protein
VTGLEQDEAKAVDCWKYVKLPLGRRMRVHVHNFGGALLIDILRLHCGACRKAAEGGSASAQHNMALAIEGGLGGLDPDPEQSIVWWEQAAAQVNILG